jgi:hypothetical protein
MKKPQNQDIIICEKCKGTYRLKEGESLADFKECGCGGKLKYVESPHKTKKPKKIKKVLLPVIAALIIVSGFAAYECNLEGILFDMVPYNYTSDVWIPPNSNSSGSLAGYYTIQGLGRDFTFFIKLPGAEKAESPLDYTKEGLNGVGRIDNIGITFNTIHALLSGDFKKAMLETKFSGNLDMTCAAWTGTGTFSSESEKLNGTFKIDGAMTDWEGTFKIMNQNNRLVLRMDYIYYPIGQKNKEASAYDIIYM